MKKILVYFTKSTICNPQSSLFDIIALFAGAILPLAFAPFDIFPTAVFSLALLLTAWLAVPPKRAFFRGWLYGVGFYVVGVSWIYVSLHVYGNASIFFAGLATLLFIVLFALYPAIQGYLLNWLFPKNNLAKILLVFPASWVLFEWVRSWLFTGFPWLLLGYTQINSPLRGFAPLFGVFGISLIVAFIAAAFVAIFYFRKKTVQISLIISIILISTMGFLLNKIHWTAPQGQAVKVSLVQGNIPQQLKWQATEVENILRTYVQLTEKKWDSDIIVWPECAIVVPNTNAKDFLEELNQKAKRHGAALITGIPIYQNFQYYNGIVTLGNGSGIFLKHHLVPFGEYVPLRSLFEIFQSFVQIPMSDFGSGPANQANIIAHGISIAPFICYEIIFPNEVIRTLPQAQLLLLVTDDSWFGDSIAPAQHLQMGQMRALETGRFLLFTANSGITAIINSSGNIQSAIPPFQTDILTDTVQPMQGTTPFVIWGSYPVLITLLLFLIVSWVRRSK